jgi:hypothetical protein
VSKLNATGDKLVYSTYLGGSAEDIAQAIAIDGAGNAYITGMTVSSDFPTASPLQAHCPANPGNPPCFESAFVAKLNPTGSALIYSTFLGGADGNTEAYGIGVDNSGNASIAGLSHSAKLPVVNAFQSSSGAAPFSAFAAKLNASGTGLLYCTYLTGKSGVGLYSKAYAVAVDSSGNAYDR